MHVNCGRFIRYIMPYHNVFKGYLRICAMYEANKNFGNSMRAVVNSPKNLLLLEILACNPASNGIITELSTRISRSAVFASCIAHILNIHVYSNF